MNLPNATSAAARFCRAADGSPELSAALRDLQTVVGALVEQGRPRRQIETAIRRGVSQRLADFGCVIEAAFRRVCA
jgi:hypothetical protein